MDVKTAQYQLISFLCLLLLGVLVRGREAFKKLCQDTSIDILTRTGVKIENVEISRVELPLVRLNGRVRRPRFKLNFEFKTRSENGVLFYGQTSGYPDELIAMILKDGNIMYKIRCSTAHADVIIPTKGNYKLNDGRWHNVSYILCLAASLDKNVLRLFPYYRTTSARPSTACFMADVIIHESTKTMIDNYRHFTSLTIRSSWALPMEVKYRSVGHKGYIRIDGFSDSKHYEVSCQNMTSLTMGGINPRDGASVDDLKNVPGHFEGCMRRVFPPTALRTPPKYYAASNCLSA